MSLNRKTLENNNIFIVETRITSSHGTHERLHIEECIGGSETHRPAPKHVSEFCRAMLDIDCTIMQRFGLKEDKDVLTLDSSPQFPQLTVAERTFITSLVQQMRDAKSSAETVEAGKSQESYWVTYFRDFFFTPFEKDLTIKDGDSRLTSRAKYYHDYIESGGDRCWNLFDEKVGFRAADRQGLTKPKCDWACYFPVYNFSSQLQILSTDRWRWTSTAQEKFVENFSLQTLHQLSNHGLHANPTERLHKSKGFQKKLVPKQNLSRPVCFPWLILEHKKADQKEAEFCNCQAANGGSAALMMLQTAARYAEDKTDCKHVPPVVTVTTVGPAVTIWVMYYRQEDGEEQYIMASIWNGSMRKLMDALYFRAILENAYTWATRVLKPCLSKYIDQWKHRHLDPVYLNEESVATLMLEEGKISSVNLSKLFEIAIQHVSGTGFHHRGVWSAESLDESDIRKVCSSENSVLLQKVESLIVGRLNDLDRKMETLESTHRTNSALIMRETCRSENQELLRRVEKLIGDRIDALKSTEQPHKITTEPISASMVQQICRSENKALLTRIEAIIDDKIQHSKPSPPRVPVSSYSEKAQQLEFVAKLFERLYKSMRFTDLKLERLHWELHIKTGEGWFQALCPDLCFEHPDEDLADDSSFFAQIARKQKHIDHREKISKVIVTLLDQCIKERQYDSQSQDSPKITSLSSGCRPQSPGHACDEENFGENKTSATDQQYSGLSRDFHTRHAEKNPSELVNPRINPLTLTSSESPNKQSQKQPLPHQIFTFSDITSHSFISDYAEPPKTTPNRAPLLSEINDFKPVRSSNGLTVFGTSGVANSTATTVRVPEFKELFGRPTPYSKPEDVLRDEASVGGSNVLFNAGRPRSARDILFGNHGNRSPSP